MPACVFASLRPRVSLSQVVVAVWAVFLLVAGALPAAAQTGNVTISTNTVWASGNYTLTSLTVNNGATLTIGSESTVTVIGAVLVTANSTVVFSSQIGAGSVVEAGSFQLDKGSTLTADGLGYAAGSGPGAGAAGTTNGGSYCGLGGGQGVTTDYCEVLGSLAAGSGGAAKAGGVAGAGGGAIELDVSTGGAVLNGTVTANGGAATGAAGGGSGGSIFVSINGNISGNGTMTANGGSNASGNGSGGGGGIVEVICTTVVAGSQVIHNSTSTGGTASGSGLPGTQGGFIVLSAGSTDPIIVSQNSSLPGGTFKFTDLTVSNGATLSLGGGGTLQVTGNLVVTGNSNIVVQSANNSGQVGGVWAGVGATINAANVEVDAGSSINADGQGYIGEEMNPGAGPGGATGYAGASYGGAGSGNILPLYGSATAPVDLGSAGISTYGGGSPMNGNGGGAIQFVVSGTLTNNGVISANAAIPTGYTTSGSGGSLYVQTATLTGSGVFTANGETNPGNTVGGGGGRIAVDYGSASGFTGFTGSVANGGTNAGPGTVAFVNTSLPNGGLSTYQDFTIPSNTAVSYDSITVQNGATVTIGGGSTVTVTGAVLVTGNSNIVVQSINNSAQVSGMWVGAGSTINAGSIEVDAGSTINADGQGYVGLAVNSGAGPAGSAGGFGAGYGGMGGSSPLPVYGSATVPLDLGSAGFSYYGATAADGNGGGAIQLVVSGTLTNNGVISANANVPYGDSAGGAGGSLYVQTKNLTGTGLFEADGGVNSGYHYLDGGGGRIAIDYASAAGFTGFTTAVAGATSPAVVGSVGFFDTSVANSNLQIYEPFPIPAKSTVTYNSITVQNGTTLTIGGGSTVNLAAGLKVTGNANVLVGSINNTALVGGMWAGAGSTINAGSVEVDAGSTINADGLGYVAGVNAAGAGPGAGTTNQGATYGGTGGQNPLPTYGSAIAPTDLGSSAYQAYGVGGDGGGAIKLVVSGTLTNNGVISANADVPTGDSGGGAGGSVYVITNGLAGAGVFEANGGVNSGYNYIDGGGGRVAVDYASASGFTGFAGSTANATAAGTVGTVAFVDTTAPNGNVSIYQNYALAPGSVTSFNSLNVAPGATVEIGGGAQLQVTQNLHISGTVTAASINNQGQVLDKWVGQGVTIYAGTATVDAGGSLTADGLGYAPRQGPGASSLGGSYGGLAAGATMGTYGSASAPTDLGSGGINSYGAGGDGGGAIQLFVAGTLTNNGNISANADLPTGDSAGGSGGSVYVGADTITGTGTFGAQGGTNSAYSYVNGGGGRVAVDYILNEGVAASQVTAGATTPATAGTALLVKQPVSAWVLPQESVIHGTATLEWFTDAGPAVTVTLTGPQTATIATGVAAFSSASVDTTAYPDGAYQLVLSVLNAAGATVQQVVKNVVINNSVQWRSGTLTTNQTWGPTPVQALDGNVIVPSGVTLTIAPGTVVKALAGAQIIVQAGGTLIANGATGLPVTFTTFDDSSVGGNTDFNQGTTLPEPGEWTGIDVMSGGTLTTNGSTVVKYSTTVLSGALGTNTTLMPTEVYIISGMVTVPKGVTLNVLPGTVVKFAMGATLDVQPGATMTANGTLAQPIYFTSINDASIGGDTNGSGGAIAPGAGDWDSIILDGATVSLQHVQIQYGGGPVNGGGQVGMIETTEAATVTIADSVIADSFLIGVQTGYPNGGGDTVTITDSIFYGNEDRAINTYSGSTVHVVNDTFDGNAGGVSNHGGVVDVENSVISNSVSSQFGQVFLCCGGTFSNISNNDVYGTVSGVPNYNGLADPTGKLGNISAYPVYMNQAVHDYRPTYGSPLIDAANGTVANYPITDAFGVARYNAPLVTTKTGTADVNGNYPDIGALEFVQSAPSNLDLTDSAVSGPTTATVGSQVTVTWTDTNLGSGSVYGPWHDAVYLVTGPDTNPVETLAGVVLEGQSTILGPGGSFSATATVTVPGVTVGTHRWEVRTNVLGEIFEGANTTNNTAISLGTVDTDLPALVPGAAALGGSFAGTGQSAYYKVVPSATQSIQVQLGLGSGVTGAVEVFVGAGYVPSPQQYDFEQTQFNSPTATVVIPSGGAQTYYVTAYAQTVTTSPAPFTISAMPLTFSLTSVSPGTAVASGNETLTFVGGGFTSATSFLLVGSSGKTYAPTSVFLEDSSHADLTFALSSVPAGSYAAEAIGSGTVTLANAVSVVASTPAAAFGASGDAALVVTLETPAAFRAGFPSVVTLHYANNGGLDMPAPMIYVSATNAVLTELPAPCAGCSPQLGGQVGSTFTSGLVLGISNSGPAGVLPAGSSGEINFLATAGSTGTATFYVANATQAPSVVQTTWVVPRCSTAAAGEACPPPVPQPVNEGSYGSATAFAQSLVPPGADQNGVTRALMQLLVNAGYSYIPFPAVITETTSGNVLGLLPFTNFNNLLAADATALSKGGDYEYDVQKLTGYELNNDGLAQFNQIYHQGAFGFGPSHPFDIVGYALPQGGILVIYPDGSQRTFGVLEAGTTNTYLGVPGDYGVVTEAADSSFLLTEQDGTMYHFPTGYPSPIDYIQDRDGNKTTLTYTAGKMTSTTDAFGNTISFVYDANGHITQFTDAAGRVTTYSYTTASYSDMTPTGTQTGHIMTGYFLTTKAAPEGTTTYTWNMGGTLYPGFIDDSCIATLCQQPLGLASVAYPDGTHTYFTYDAAGRMASRSLDGGVNKTTYSYGVGGAVTTTDALGNATVSQAGLGGSALSVLDPLGSQLQLRSDTEGKLTTLIGPKGDFTYLGYDGNGNLSSLQSALGETTTLNFGATQALQSATDPNGNTTTYGSDSSGNLTTVTAPDGKAVQRTYDSHGRPLTVTNKRGHTTTYTYGSNGLLASKTYASGTVYTYGYDSHFNLTSTTTPAGKTNYSYDGADRLTQVSNPDGTYIKYGYDAGGRRTSTTDSTGHTLQYSYDAAGRLATLKDGSGNMLATYGYDLASHVTSKTLGNGTTAAMTYDANGRVSTVTNKAPSGTVLSQYTYTYDPAGNVSQIGEPSGTMNLGYDTDGRLTSVATATNTTAYTYDAASNRTSLTSGGTTSNVNPNNLDEAINTGGKTNVYDADGNCTVCSGMTYTYDDDNNVTSMTDTSGNTTTYTQDALGDTVQAITSAGATAILNDLGDQGEPYTHLAIGTVVDNNFAPSGQAVAPSQDLVSTTQTGGTPSTNYYSFDGQGNTVQTTAPSGSVTGTASYMPLGDQPLTATVLPTPFTFQGQDGTSTIAPNTYSLANGPIYNGQQGDTQQASPAVAPGTGNSFGQGTVLNNQPLDSAGFSFAAVGMLGISVNLHTGDIYVTGGLSTGAGPSVTVSRLNDSTTTGDARGAAVDDAITGPSISAGAAAGVTVSPTSGASFTDLTTGGREVGASAGYTINLSQKIGSTRVGQAAGAVGRGFWRLGDWLMGGRLFNDGDQDVLNPNHKLPTRCPGCAPPPPNPCGSCLFPPVPGQSDPVAGAHDPNGKITSGFGDQGFVPVGSPIVYTIYFENQATATAPAQVVTVTDPLASNLDWSTVQFSQIEFNNVTLSLPAGVSTYSTKTTVATDPNPVAVSAKVNPTTGVVSWTMQSVDPVTGLAPANPLAGFLPPNNAANAGSGYVTFSVMPKAGLANGTTISNQGSIVFDVNAAIATNTVTNTLDNSTVTSAITPMAATTSSPTFPVSWTGSDTSGSGIAFYNIYVAIDGGAFQLWLSATTLTTANYTGTPSHSYSFTSMATNNVGITQGAIAAPQTVAISALVPVVTVTPAATSIPAGAGVSVGITVTNALGAPTGSVVLSSGTYSSAAVTLASGAATIVVPAGVLGSGVDTLTVTYTPDSTSAGLFSAGSGTAQVTVGTVPAALAIAPGTLTFTAYSGATSAAQSVTLTNTGGSTLSFGSITLTGAGAAVFADTTTCGATLGVGASCAVSVTFSPAAVASYSAALAIADNATGSPQTVTLAGTGTVAPAPVLGVAPAALTFTAVSGTTSAAQTVTLTNSGNAVLNLTQIALTGSGAGSFAKSTTCGTTLAASASCTVAVTFSPTAAGSVAATLTLTDNAAGSPQSVLLSGTGTAAPAPALGVAPAALTFSAVSGTTSAAQTVTLTNTGSAVLNLTQISLAGSGAAVFADTTTCGTTLAASASCTVAVTFSPTATGSVAATLTLTDNAAGSPQSVVLSGTGTAAPAPLVGVAPAALTFSAVSGTTSAAQTVTLTNTGSAVLNLTQIALAGSGAGFFAKSTTCGTTLAASASCTVAVTFSPTAAGSVAATLTLTDNAAGSPQSVVLSGTGTAAPTPILGVAPAALTFTAVSGTTSPAQTVTLTNTGSAVLNLTGITLTGSGAAAFAQTTTCGTTLAVNANCSVSVTFSPTAVAGYTATLSIADNAAGSPQTVALTGTGSAVPTFTLSATPSTLNVLRGGTAQYTIVVTPVGGTFNGTVSLAASGVQAGLATLSPATVTLGSSPATATLSVATSSLALDRNAPLAETIPVLACGALLLFGMRRRGKPLRLLMVLLAALIAGGAMSGCGGSGGQKYTITVTGTGMVAGSTQAQTQTVNVTLTVN